MTGKKNQSEYPNYCRILSGRPSAIAELVSKGELSLFRGVVRLFRMTAGILIEVRISGLPVQKSRKQQYLYWLQIETESGTVSFPIHAENGYAYTVLLSDRCVSDNSRCLSALLADDSLRTIAFGEFISPQEIGVVQAF